MTDLNAKAQHTLNRACTVMTLDHIFFGSLLLRLGLEATDQLPTMATDGKRILYNVEFTAGLPQDECVGVLAHEVLHVALRHPLRIGNRYPMLWNVACDYAINAILIAAGFKLPKDALYDKKWEGKTAEAIYEELLKDAVIIQIGGGQGEGGQDAMPGDGKDQSWGKVFRDKGMSEAEAKTLEREIEIAVTSAANVAKARGKLPAAFEGLVKESMKPQVDWRERVRLYMQGGTNTDFSFRRPNRRMMAQDMLMPGLIRIGAGRGVLGIDTSGSVSNIELQHYLGEMRAIVEELSPDQLIVLTCDTKLRSEREYGPGEQIEHIEVNGRGGTDMTPIFDYIEEMAPKPDFFVMLTDLEMNFPDDPGVPVLWVSTGGDKAPFGEVVKLTVKH